MEPTSESKADAEEVDKKSSDDNEEEKEVEIDPNTLFLTEAEKKDARDRFDLVDIDYDGMIDAQQTKTLLEGTNLYRIDVCFR